LFFIVPTELLIVVTYLSLKWSGGLLLGFLTRLLSVVVIILIHSLQLLGYFNHLNIKYVIVPKSWLQSITAYFVNKRSGILTPRHELRYLRILATIKNSLTFERIVTFIYYPNYYSIIISNQSDLNVFITDFIINQGDLNVFITDFIIKFNTTLTYFLGLSTSSSTPSSNSSNSSANSSNSSSSSPDTPDTPDTPTNTSTTSNSSNPRAP
jgi:hypothetical protein